MDIAEYDTLLRSRAVDHGWISQANTLKLLDEIKRLEGVYKTALDAYHREVAYREKLETRAAGGRRKSGTRPATEQDEDARASLRARKGDPA